MGLRKSRDQMNIVVIGHVDHGKSTLIGRLLADTGSLPEGKLESVKASCVRNAKPFEYAFLLDALKDEQSQGITIDSARCFFKSAKRDYIIIDAPGHIEFLKNMISGAARAEAAILLIDAKEGIQENSRRHGYMMAMLNIKQIAVCVNKMDLVNYKQEAFEKVTREYKEFLSGLNIKPVSFIPVSARVGDNITRGSSKNMPWYKGPHTLEIIDSFPKEEPPLKKPFRFPLQDIYKFTGAGDDRRILAGRIETGSINVGDKVVFYPSEKTSTIKTIENFNSKPKKSAHTGESTGFTLNTQIYLKPGEIMCKASDPKPFVGSQIKANIFWMGRQPMVKGKKYKMKLAASRLTVWLDDISSVLDASKLSHSQTDAQDKVISVGDKDELVSISERELINRHDVAECVLQSLRPIACDLAEDLPLTGRFVIVDNYEIAGGGIITETLGVESKILQDHIETRADKWERSRITTDLRFGQYGQKSVFVILTGEREIGKQLIAKALEESLFESKRLVYYLGLSNTLLGMDSDFSGKLERDEYLRRLGELAHLFTDSGHILITTISELDDYEVKILDTLAQPGKVMLINIGENRFNKREVDLSLPKDYKLPESVKAIKEMLLKNNVLTDYYL